ncbi:MAG: TonB-dependent receptor, partial [Proteobacteria bacterium]|nr:TonB-dependent receptor [Pseudomonadota bacterium]
MSKGENLRFTLLGAALLTGLAAFGETPGDGEIEEVIVVGQRAMLQSAIARQKESDVIKSVITRDAIGQFPDQNVAESVRRLPGVNVLNDQGEGRFIAVRGLDPSLNSASINGTRIPSPESDTRSVALDVIASELVESIEIIKMITPDMDADTIGAAIRINTTSALDADPFVTVKAEQSYNDLNDEYSPKGSIDFAYPLSDNLAVSGGLSYAEREFSTDNVEPDGWDISDTGIVYADTVEYRDYDVLRERTGASLSLDYQPSDSTTLYARLIYSLFDDTEERRRLTIELDEQPASGSATTASFLSDDGTIAVERESKDRFESQEIASYQFGGSTEIEAWELDYSIVYSRAEEHEHRTEDPTNFVAEFEDPGNLAITFDYADMELPRYAVTAGTAAFLDPTSYEFDKLELVNGKAEDEEWAFQFDASRQITLDNGDLELKLGAKFRQRTKEFDLLLQVYDGFSGNYTLADVAGAQSYGLTSINPLTDLSRVRAFNAANFASFEINQADTDFESNIEDFTVDEDITAGYVMVRYETGPLMIVGGVRVEKTENDIQANLTEYVEEGGVYNGVVLADDTVFVTPNDFSKSYTDALPSASLRYDWSEDVLLRAGFFK